MLELIRMGKNTGKTEIKMPGEIKKAFAAYVKAAQYLEVKEYENATPEAVMAAWLKTFEESEEYKTITEQAKEAKAAAKAKNEADKAAAKAKREADAEAKRQAAIAKKQRELWELEHPEEAKAQKEAEKKQSEE
jgi:colicin import membrane protein